MILHKIDTNKLYIGYKSTVDDSIVIEFLKPLFNDKDILVERSSTEERVFF